MHTIIATSTRDIQAAFKIRKEIFVNEQNVPIEEELDRYDAIATHFLLYLNNNPIGAGRCRKLNNALKAERICILQSFRKLGAGRHLMQYIEDYAIKENIHYLKLDSQTHAIGFYQSLNFRTVSEEFLDAGIPHVTMIKHLNNY